MTTLYVGAHYERTGSATKKYYSSGGVRVAMRDSALPDNPYYLLGDHLGSTAMTADNNGAKYAELRYKAWGENRHTDGTTPTTYRYTGQREDADIGLYFYNARYYDASLGRFVQPDTIVPGAGNSQAYNRYAYALNNPLRYADPTGHFTEDELLAFGVDSATLAHWKRNTAWWKVIMGASLGDEISWTAEGGSATRYYGVFALMESPKGPVGAMWLGVLSRTSGEVASLQQFYGKTGRHQLSTGDVLPRSGIPAALRQEVIPRMGPGGSHASMSAWDAPSPDNLTIDDGWAAPTLDAVAATCAYATSVCRAQQLPQGVTLGTLCTSGITAYQLGRDAWNVAADGTASSWASLIIDVVVWRAEGTLKSAAQALGFAFDIHKAAR